MLIKADMTGKTVIITGASKGIGLETARVMHSLGANLMLGSRTIEADTEQWANDERVFVQHVDVTCEESVTNFFRKAAEQFGTIDILINSAGVGVFSSFIESSTDDFNQMIDVNLRGTYLCSKHAAKQMVKQQHGHIINVISIAGTTALPGCAAYSASKFGVLGLTRVMQQELRQQGVQVTALLPGAVSSSFWDEIEPKPDLNQMIPVKYLAQHIAYVVNQPAGAVIDEMMVMPPLGIL